MKKSTRLAVVLGLSAAVCFTASGCAGEVKVDRFSRAPATESLKQVTRPSDPTGADAAESPMNGDNAAADTDGEDSDETTGANSTQAAEPASASTQIPDVVYPHGVETRLTPPGTELAFGEKAIVASSDADGRLLIWSMVGYAGWPIAGEDVSLLSSATDEVWDFACFSYELTYLGAVADISVAGNVLPGVVDASYAGVVPPMVVPGTPEGWLTTRLAGGADNACNIPAESRLPVDQENLELSTPYIRSVVGAVKPDSAPEAQPASLMYLFDYGIPGVLASEEEVEPIYWG